MKVEIDDGEILVEKCMGLEFGENREKINFLIKHGGYRIIDEVSEYDGLKKNRQYGLYVILIDITKEQSK